MAYAGAPINYEQQEWVENTLAQMTLDEKVGQLFVVASSMKSTKGELERLERLIRQYHVGGVLFVERGPWEEVMKRARRCQAVTKYPLFTAVDAENGLGFHFDGVMKFPNNMTLGALRDNTLLYVLGKEIARQCKLISVNFDLAPVVDVNSNPANPIINVRSFGEDPARVARKGLQLVRGFQNNGIIACAKHFPGHGDTFVDSHKTLPTVDHDFDYLKGVDLYPFKKLIDNGVMSVMVGHLKVPALTKDECSSLSYDIVTKLLRKDLDFNGLIVSDALNMFAVTDLMQPDEAVLQAIAAGNDVILYPTDVEASIEAVKKAVVDGRIPEKKLNRHLLRILQAKAWLGMFRYSNRDDKVTIEDIETPFALTLRKRLYQKAMTLLQDKEDLLPLPYVSMGNATLVQIGNKTETPFVKEFKKSGGTKCYCVGADVSAQQASEIIGSIKPNTVVLVGIFGLNNDYNKNFGVTGETKAFMKHLRDEKQCKICLVVFGTPYALKFFGNEDVIIAAYEEAQGAQEAAMEVILGKIMPRGSLPVTVSSRFEAGKGLVSSNCGDSLEDTQ